jgi:hypothetical protein
MKLASAMFKRTATTSKAVTSRLEGEAIGTVGGQS